MAIWCWFGQPFSACLSHSLPVQGYLRHRWGSATKQTQVTASRHLQWRKSKWWEFSGTLTRPFVNFPSSAVGLLRILLLLLTFCKIFFFYCYKDFDSHSQATCRATAFTASWGGTLWHAFQSSQLMEKTGESKTKLPKHCSVDWGKYHYVGSGCHVKTINNHNLKLPSAMNHSRSNRSCLSPLKISLDP